jgi:hypothetical protein
MKRLIAVLLLCSCYHMKNARFVDESENDPKTVWICAPDDDATNPGGISCASVKNLVGLPPPPGFGEPLQGPKLERRAAPSPRTDL